MISERGRGFGLGRLVDGSSFASDQVWVESYEVLMDADKITDIGEVLAKSGVSESRCLLHHRITCLAICDSVPVVPVNMLILFLNKQDKGCEP
jgi:hypothetical protein